MEKMDLQLFRELRDELIGMVNEIDIMIENGEEPSQDSLNRYKTRYMEIYKELSEHDLSDIDFEEWRGMPLFNSDEQTLDFSQTNANIDFSIIEFVRDTESETPNFKGCKIRNFDFENTIYTPEMFDQQFISDNNEYFLSDDAPEELKQAYYGKNLTIQLISGNIEFLKGKKVAKHINRSLIEDRDNLALVDLYGDDLIELFEKYKPILDIMIENNGLKMVKGVLDENEESVDKTRDELLKESIIDFFSSDIQSTLNRVSSIKTLKLISEFIPLSELPWRNQRIRSVFEKYSPDELLEYGISDARELLYRKPDLYTLKELLDTIPDDLILEGGANNNKIRFIRKYGIDNIIRLDEETNGMFSFELWKNDIYLEVFARADTELEKNDITEDFGYEDFKNRMYDILVNIRGKSGLLRSGDIPDYDFIQGPFRDEHSDIFLNGDFDPELKRKFYICTLTAKDIHDNPDIVLSLKDKDLVKAFQEKRMISGFSANFYNKDGSLKGRVPNMVNMVEFFTKKFGNEVFLRLCNDYGKCLDSVAFSLDTNDSLEVIREKIEDQIYKQIINLDSTIEYFEDLPDSFKIKHPELFLPDNIPIDIRNKFYQGNLTFSDVKQHPELKEILLTKNTKIGFRNSSYTVGDYGNIIFGISELWNKFSDKELLNLAEIYGNYLEYVDSELLNENQSIEEKILIIENSIEKKILNREAPYGFNVPDFFKKKYPEMFLDDNAPEELKIFFDEDLYMKHLTNQKNDVSNRSVIDFEKIIGNGIAVDGKLSFQLLKEHSEWIPFLKGKNFRLAFPNNYDKLFVCFDCDTLLRIGPRNADTIKRMVDLNKVGLLETWFKATGGKFIPHHVVMNYFPEDEIDSFLNNSRKWSKLTQVENFNINDDGKAAVLKIAYSLGVFEGNDDGYKLAMDLISGLPEKINNADFISAMKLLEDDAENRDLLEKSYKLDEDGNYVLNYDQQSDKKKTKIIRNILEKANVSTVLTLKKAHQIFGGFEMKYDPDFVKFFKGNLQRIVSDYRHFSDISQIQRRFNEIKTHNASVKGGITFDVAYNYIRNTPYNDVEVGNEKLAKLVSQRGYSQEDFEKLQVLYDEAETRDFSSIPRIVGETDGYTYEMLRLDDPLGLVIGKITDCCQEINDAGRTSMEHSMISQDGRVFVVRDETGRIVAQSWVWRNQNVLCFDNIEIPNAIMEDYNRKHPEEGKKGIARHVLDAYKHASKEIMLKDEERYKELLEEETITREEYDSLILGKITVGLGWNDTAEAIKEDSDLVRDDVNDLKLPLESDRFPYLYTDAKYDPNDRKNYEGQWIIESRVELPKSDHIQARVFEDDIEVFDENNIDNATLFMIQRMGINDINSNIKYIDQINDNEDRSSNDIMSDIAYAYGFDSKDTRVLTTPRIALIYTKSNGRIVIGDVFTAPLKTGLTKEQQLLAQKHIRHQIKKAIKQIGASGESIDLSELDENRIGLIQSILKEIDEEKQINSKNNSDKRGENEHGRD